VDQPKIIVICGPTGSGKTSTAIQLAQAFNGGIIGADSMQIYRYMNIATAKRTRKEQEQVRHYMIDIVEPDERFDAAQYSRLARETVSRLLDCGALPFVVGGTGFYIKALLGGLFPSLPADPAIRKRLKAEAGRLGTPALYRRLAELDPDAAANIHRNDTYRILRALEVREHTGKPISSLHRCHRFQDRPFDALVLGLRVDRRVLYDRINRRVDAMIQEGLKDEVSDLLERGYAPDLKSMGSIGYRHMITYLRGHEEWDEMIRLFQRDTRRYAKRQLTWFARDNAVQWYAPDDIAGLKERITCFLNSS